jgi:hypothetical protein
LSVLRDRFREWLDSGDRRWVIPAIMGAGLAQISSQIVAALTENRETATKLPQSGYIAVLVVWPIFTIALTWLNAVLLRWTGRFLKGSATVRELFVAHGWSLAPVALGSPLIAAEALALIRGAADPEQIEGLPSMAALVVGVVVLYTSVLSIVRFVVAISEVQRFSKWRVLGNIALTALVLLGISAATVGVLTLTLPKS